MKRKLILKFLIITLISPWFISLDASEQGTFISDKIVKHNGFSGQWISFINNEQLDNTIKIYSTGEKDVIASNGSDYRTKEKIFIPFSESYLAYLKNRAACSSISGSNPGFIWPIENFDRVSSSFGRRWQSFHEGIDIPAGRGVPIIAAGSGRVIYSGYSGNLGHTVTIEHRDNMITRYCHASELLVKEGEIVKQGQVVANVGSSGNSTGNHLHFEIRYGDFPLNPLDFLPFSPCVKQTQYMKKID